MLSFWESRDAIAAFAGYAGKIFHRSGRHHRGGSAGNVVNLFVASGHRQQGYMSLGTGTQLDGAEHRRPIHESWPLEYME